MTIAEASDSFGLEIIILLFFYEAVAGRLLQVGRGRLFRTSENFSRESRNCKISSNKYKMKT